MDEKIRALKDELLELNERAQVIQATADAEHRPLTEDEQKELDGTFARFDSIEDEISRRELIIAQTAKLSQSQGRKSDAQAPDAQNAVTDLTPVQARQQRRPVIQIVDDKRGKWGYSNMGEFALAVRAAARQGGTVDPRLVMNATTTYSSEGQGADGPPLEAPAVPAAPAAPVEPAAPPAA